MDKHVQFFRRWSGQSADEWFDQTRIIYADQRIGRGDPVAAMIRELFATESLLENAKALERKPRDSLGFRSTVPKLLTLALLFCLNELFHQE